MAEEQQEQEKKKKQREALLVWVGAGDVSILLNAPAELKSDAEFMLEAVKLNGNSLAYASEELKANKELVLAAVKKNGHALQYASKELQQDKELIDAANKTIAAEQTAPQVVAVAAQPVADNAQAQSTEPVLGKANDYAVTLKVLRALKNYKNNPNNASREPAELADYLAENDATLAGYSSEEIFSAFGNIKNFSGKSNLPSAVDSLTDIDVKRQYERFKSAQQEKMNIIANDLGPAKDDAKEASREYSKNQWGLFGARMGRAGIVLGGTAAAVGYVGGAITLAGGLAALTAVSSMGLLTVAAIGGVILYRVGKALLPKAFKALGNIITNLKKKIKGNELGSRAEHRKRANRQRDLQSQYDKHKTALMDAQLSSAEQLFNQIVDPAASLAARQDALGNANVNAAAVAAAQNAAPAVPVVEPLTSGAQRVMQPDPIPAHSTEADYRRLARENSDPITGHSRDRNIYYAPTDIVMTDPTLGDREHWFNLYTGSAPTANDTNISYAASDRPNYAYGKQAQPSSSSTTTGRAGYQIEQPAYNASNYNVAQSSSTQKAPRRGGIEYTYPVSNANVEVYNASRTSTATQQFTLKDADVETFAKMALRMDLPGAVNLHDVARTNGKVDVNQNKRLVDLSAAELELSDEQAREAAKGILATTGIIDPVVQQNYLNDDTFMNSVKHEMGALRAVVQQVKKASNNQRVTLAGGGYTERGFIQDIVNGKVILDGKSVKEIINDYFTANSSSNLFNANERHELLTTPRVTLNGDVQKPLDPRKIERLGAIAGLTQFDFNNLSDSPEYTEYLTDQEFEAIKDLFADMPQIETRQQLEEVLHNHEIRIGLETKLNSSKSLTDQEKTLLDLLRRQSENNKANNNHQDIHFEYDPNLNINAEFGDALAETKPKDEAKQQDKAKLEAIQNFVETVSEEEISDHLIERLKAKKDLSAEEQVALEILQNNNVMSSNEYANHLKQLANLQKSLSTKKSLTDEETLILITLNDSLADLSDKEQNKAPEIVRYEDVGQYALEGREIPEDLRHNLGYGREMLEDGQPYIDLTDMIYGDDGAVGNYQPEQESKVERKIEPLTEEEKKRKAVELFDRYNVESKRPVEPVIEQVEKSDSARIVERGEQESLYKTIVDAFAKVFPGVDISNREVMHAYNDYCQKQAGKKLPAKTEGGKRFKKVSGSEHTSFARLYNEKQFNVLNRGTYDKLLLHSWDEIARGYADHLKTQEGTDWATRTYKGNPAIMTEEQLKARLKAAKNALEQQEAESGREM